MEAVAIILAAAALVVSLASLYTTALRGAEVWIDVIPHPEGKELGRGGAINNVPADERIHLLVLVSNTGAHGGVLEKVEFTRFEYLGAEPRLWSGIGRAALQVGPLWSKYNETETDLPLALEAGEVETRWLAGRWQHSNDETEHASNQPVLIYAEKVRGLRGIKVDIEWTYRRVAGGWRSLIPGKMGRRRETVVESTTVEPDGAPWVEACRRAWRSEYPPAINVLEGRAWDDDGETSDG